MSPDHNKEIHLLEHIPNIYMYHTFSHALWDPKGEWMTLTSGWQKGAMPGEAGKLSGMVMSSRSFLGYKASSKPAWAV